MKIPAGYLPLLIAVLLSMTTAAQDKPVLKIDTTFGDYVDRDIYQLLRIGETDTVIRFDLPLNYSYDSNGVLASTHTYYILYRSGNNTFIKKGFYFASCEYKTGPGISGPVTIPNDTLFSWLHQHAASIEKEEIALFVTQLNHAPTNTGIYVAWRPTHTFGYRIWIFTRDKKIDKCVTPYDLNKTNDHMINLNYEYNTGTKLCQLFYLLEERCKTSNLNKLPL